MLNQKYQFMNEETKTVPGLSVKKLTLKVAYNDFPYKQRSQTDWGFAVFITGTEKTILFDVGGRYLFDRMRRLKIEPDSVDVVVLSHIHSDHLCELSVFLQRNPNVIVYMPASLPKEFKDSMSDYGAKIIGVKESLQICENVYSTGELGEEIKEHSLIIRTNRGLVLITSCAHRGIVNVVNTARELIRGRVFLVMGGFHDDNCPLPLEWTTQGRIKEIISAFEQIGVRYVAPCHCCGERVRSLFKRYFGRKYINIGTEKILTLADLK
jgi:7,8-dihydropterin-6-yl-methyl-4-(beta-D-ribofuranosyl)aminobenzene 5'-phosphate synthase